MKSISLILLFLVFTCLSYSQENTTDYNLSFEKIDAQKKLPAGAWFTHWNQPGYTLNIDSAVKSGGKYSVRIDASKDRKTEAFGCIAYNLPVNFTGYTVRLTGKLKLENVEQGSAGLILRIDGDPGDILQFDNMLQHQINGTIGWKEYSVQLPLPEDAKTIYFGSIVNGSGKVWADDLMLQIDGVNISEVKTAALKFYKADSDHEFDNGSNVAFTDLNERTIDNLYHLGKIWGFLKYYHPKIAAGEYNWDYELFRIIPKVTAAATDSERDKIFLEWINSIGTITEFDDKNISEIKNVSLLPELEWTKNPETFSAELLEKLAEIRNARRTDTSYYISQYEYVGNPKFLHEKKYTNTTLDDGYRLLGLFRYWNMIEYFFPNKFLANEDWNLVLKEFIPEFTNGKTDTEYHLNALKIIARIHDSHANVWGFDKFIDDYRGKNMPPLEITFIEEKPVVTGFLSFLVDNMHGTETAFRTGDEIISVNGKPVEEIIKEQLPLTPGSNYTTQLRDLGYRFLRTNDTLITLQFIRDGARETKDIKCFSKDIYNYGNVYEKEKNKPSWKLISNDIGYIYPGTLKIDSVDFVMNKLKDTKGIVIDFRTYPSDFPIYHLGKHLMPLPTPFAKFTIGSIVHPGLFVETETIPVGDTNTNYYKGKIVIIINEVTQSSAEFHTMAWRTAPNAKVIGSTTAGADGNVSEIYFPGGIKTMISGIGVLTPDGKQTQRVGIIPDIEVKRTIKGFKEGKDELLDKGVELIMQ